MNKPVLDTLFYPFTSGVLKAAGKRAVFLNAQAHLALGDFGEVQCVQHFKPYAAGFALAEELEEPVDVVLVALPKNMVEARFVVAQGLELLGDQGVLVVAADNKAGGGRIAGVFEGFGVTDYKQESRNKCRVVWACSGGYARDAVVEAVQAGGRQDILDGLYVSQPGVFGWDKVDRGSALLVEYFPERFEGCGADFGCGYGYLSRAVMERGARQLYAIDADRRAVECAGINLHNSIPLKCSLGDEGGVNPGYGASDQVVCLWEDIVASQGLPEGLDFVVMNPPFHEGKAADSGIGLSFIEQAARCLRKGGVLWMVANAHLPYERALEGAFSRHERLAQRDGFKVFKAVK